MRTKYFPSNATIRAQRGAAVVELALVTIVMMLIVAGTIGFGRAFWYADALTKATRDGARLMSTWPIADIRTVGVVKARDLAASTANAADVKPSLVAPDNVLVECLDPSFSPVACADGTKPANVRVSITGFRVTIGEWFPFIFTTGRIDYGSVGLAPHTTMRYMN